LHLVIEAIALLIPDTLKFLLIIGAIVASVYGSAYGLSQFPPEQSDIVRPVFSEALKQN
jgi:hypothetical protein